MEPFLKKCRTNLSKANSCREMTVVIGTEACDLDSAVSSFVTAYIKDNIHNEKEELVLPVMNVTREDLLLKTEVRYLLEANGISLDLLICRDEVDIKELHKENKLRLILVDHNVLAPSDLGMEMSVIEIIDHHKEEHNNRFPRAKVLIEPVGSCCTLVAEKLMKEKPDLLDENLAKLLYGTILMDTVCLSSNAQRTTPKDKELVEHLESFLGYSKRETIFSELQFAKCDTSGLTIIQLLRKDLKTIKNSIVTIAISTVPISMEEFHENGDENALLEFCNTNCYNCLVVMFFVTDGSTITRQLTVYSPVNVVARKICEVLESASLQLVPLPNSDSRVYKYEQENRAASRKIVLPALRSFLDDSCNLFEIEQSIKKMN